MDHEHIVNLILRVGELLLTSGAEIYRVEETVQRIGLAAGFSQVEVYAIPTGIFITAIPHDGKAITRIRRIRFINNNLTNIVRINALSRRFVQGMSLDELEREIGKIHHSALRKRYAFLAGGLGSGAFVHIFGGSWLNAVLAVFVGGVVMVISQILSRERIPHFFVSAVGAMVAAALGLYTSGLVGVSPDVTILGSVMVLVPGVAMTTALRDTLSGELVSGVSRGADAMIIAVAVAVGVALVIGVGGAF